MTKNQRVHYGRTRMHCGRILAHLYCLFHWSWAVYYSGKNPAMPEYIFAGHKNGGDLVIEVFTYPEWLIKEAIK